MRLFSEVTFVTVSFIMYGIKKKEGKKWKSKCSSPNKSEKDRSEEVREGKKERNENERGEKKRRTRESKNQCKVNERLNECDEERTKKKGGSRRIRRVFERDVPKRGEVRQRELVRGKRFQCGNCSCHGNGADVLQARRLVMCPVVSQRNQNTHRNRFAASCCCWVIWFSSIFFSFSPFSFGCSSFFGRSTFLRLQLRIKYFFSAISLQNF